MLIIPAGTLPTTTSFLDFLITNSDAVKSMSINLSNDGEKRKFAELRPFRMIGYL